MCPVQIWSCQNRFYPEYNPILDSYLSTPEINCFLCFRDVFLDLKIHFIENVAHIVFILSHVRLGECLISKQPLAHIENTSLAVKGAFTHRLQHHTVCNAAPTTNKKWLQGGTKVADQIFKGPINF